MARFLFPIVFLKEQSLPMRQTLFLYQQRCPLNNMHQNDFLYERIDYISRAYFITEKNIMILTGNDGFRMFLCCEGFTGNDMIMLYVR